jgi:hypothetical protein
MTRTNALTARIATTQSMTMVRFHREVRGDAGMRSVGAGALTDDRFREDDNGVARTTETMKSEAAERATLMCRRA